MAIDTNLLIMAPVLQDYLVDKDTGFPLAAGVVTFYEDSQRQILKNWYYQSTNSAPYQFSAGPNPMTLSGVGTFTDANGNDVIPFFYPFDETNPTIEEPYYITVYNSNGELQFTRANFPFVPSTPQPGAAVPTLDNYLVNNEFWRNFGSGNLSTPNSTTQINGLNYLYQTLAPSSHDGFSMPDMIILKDIAGATETLTFQTFNTGDQILEDDITPEYYLEWNCTAFQSGQTLKCIQFPLQLHIEALSQVSATVCFHAKVNSGAANYPIVVQILQFTGTGQTNSQFLPIQTFTINTSWNKYITEPFLLPFADSLSKAATGDDALYVQFVFPPTSNFDIFFTKPQLYLSDDIPTNQWDNYDQIDAVINSPRTGDIRTSLNSFQSFGWVQMNDGVISNGGIFVLPAGVPAARHNQDTWQLFSLIWNNVSNTFAPIYDNLGVASTRGGSAIADWNANKQLQLTLALGRAVLGLPLPPGTVSNYNTGTGVFTVNAPFGSYIYVGSPIILTGAALPSAFTANTVYYAVPGSSTTFTLATSYANALTNTIITGGTAGTPPFTANYALGGTLGEPTHVQLENQLAAHNHPGSTIFGTIQNYCAGGGASTYNTTGLPTSASVQIATDGSSAPFNIIQPSVYYNIFMKL